MPEAELGLIRAGMGATIISDQAGETCRPVRIVTSEVNAQSRLGTARVALNGGSGLRPGMFARANIDVGAAPVLAVPSDAVIFREGRPASMSSAPTTRSGSACRHGGPTGGMVAITWA